MTIEQCELFSLPKSYHCIQVEEIGVWPLVPKNKILASFLMAIPTPQRIGSGRAAEKGLRMKPNVGFILNYTLLLSAPNTIILSTLKKMIWGVCVVCECSC